MKLKIIYLHFSPTCHGVCEIIFDFSARTSRAKPLTSYKKAILKQHIGFRLLYLALLRVLNVLFIFNRTYISKIQDCNGLARNTDIQMYVLKINNPLKLFEF